MRRLLAFAGPWLAVVGLFAIFELGMNHSGEIGPLSQMVRPHIAIITAIAPVHLEYFKSLDGIADAKAEIFEGLEADGAAVLNRDSDHFDYLASKAAEMKVGWIVSFGAHEKADSRLLDCALQPGGSTVHASILGHDVRYKIGAPGRHLVINSLAVLSAAALRQSANDWCLWSRRSGDSIVCKRGRTMSTSSRSQNFFSRSSSKLLGRICERKNCRMGWQLACISLARWIIRTNICSAANTVLCRYACQYIRRRATKNFSME